MKINIIPKNNFSVGNMLIILAVFLSQLNLSCKKFVDIKKSSQQNLLQTANDCQLLLDNYANMNTGYPSDGEASADDYYLNDVSYLSSTLSQTDRDLYSWSASAIRQAALPQWQSPYKTVYLSNLVLETVDRLRGSNTDATTLNNLRGSALFFRAFAFWQVAQLYAKPYILSTSGQDLGIPLRLNSDINYLSERGTVAQTYDRIIQDLREAAELLSPTSSIASRPNKAAAYAMLARTYLSMEDYPSALTSANAALQLNNQLLDFNTISKTSTTPFSPRFNKEVIFHAVMAPDPGLNPGSATSNFAKIDPALVASYAINDLRGQLFIKPNTGSNAGSYRFSGNYEPVTTAVLFDGLAVDELYLTRAECYARAGDLTSAINDLNTLLRTRWITGTYVDIVATSTDDALNKILTERRKELLMRGLRWTDLRRLNRDNRFSKSLSRSAQGTTYNLPPIDTRYVLLIPNEVIQNSSISQNPR